MVWCSSVIPRGNVPGGDETVQQLQYGPLYNTGLQTLLEPTENIDLSLNSKPAVTSPFIGPTFFTTTVCDRILETLYS